MSEKYDEFTRNVKILPWIGKNYHSQKVKLLILGESIWYREEDVPLKKQAINYIESVIDGWNGSNFFSNIQKVVQVKDFDKNNLSDRKIFWNNVAFYEYVQSELSQAGERPNVEQWENAQKPFKEILKKLQPDFVLAFGFELFKNLPHIDGDENGLYIRYNNKRIHTWVYRINEKPMVLIRFKHPSRGFSPEYWRKIYQKVIDCYKGSKL